MAADPSVVVVEPVGPRDVLVDIKSYGSFEDGRREEGKRERKESKEIRVEHDEKEPGAGAPGGVPGGILVDVSDDPDHPVLRPVLDKQQSLEHLGRATPHREKDPLMDMAKNMVRMGFDMDISVEALKQTRLQSIELAVDRVFRIQDDIEKLERAHLALDREEKENGIVRSTPRPRVTVTSMVDAQRQLAERKEGLASALSRNHWACDRCTFLNKNPVTVCAVCEQPREEVRPSPRAAIGIPLPVAHPGGGGGGGGIAAAAALDRKAPAPPADTKQCLICFDDIPLAEIVHAPCSHDYCAGCWSGFLTDRVNDGRVLKIVCPDPECKRELEGPEIKRRLPAELIPKYEKFLASAELSLDSNIRWCQTAGCETSMRGTKSKPHLTCPKCRAELCFNCNEKWHGRQTCESAGDALMAAYRREHNVKLCPKCRAAIERTAGCNHMTCSRCRYEFCWMCRGEYGPNHFAPWNIFGCPGLQDGVLAFIADDSCCCCNLSLGCGVAGFIKRFFFRVLLLMCLLIALGIGIPFGIVCCPCIVFYLIMKDR